MDGERLSELRKDYGLNQKQMADILSVSKNTISLYERNKMSPNDDVKVKIAKLFNVSLDYLYGITDIQNYTVSSKSHLVYIDGLPDEASKEINYFIKDIKKKYSL